MKQNNIKTKNNLIYGVNDNPNLLTKILLGFQHIFAAFGGIIVVPLVISSSLGFDPIMSTAVISASILAAGIATIIQANGVGKIGSQVACIMGTDFTFVSPAISVGSVLGLPGIIGATILGAFFEIIFMTYSYVHRAINTEAFPSAIDLYNKQLMTGRGRGKYMYKNYIREEGEVFLRENMKKYFPNNEIMYVV